MINATIKEAIWQSAKKSALFIAGSVLFQIVSPPLRDPTITLVVTGARLTWNIGSWGFKYNENKQEQIAIAQGKIIFSIKRHQTPYYTSKGDIIMDQATTYQR